MHKAAPTPINITMAEIVVALSCFSLPSRPIFRISGKFLKSRFLLRGKARRTGSIKLTIQRMAGTSCTTRESGSSDGLRYASVAKYAESRTPEIVVTRVENLSSRR
jgi:hypothetical protein